MADTQLFRVWCAMRNRCNNPKVKCYPRYGGRGITVFDKWNESFESFYSDMGPRPHGASLDRINNDGPYSLDNCRWATPSEQASNKRSSRIITFRGESRTQAQWAIVTGIDVRKIHKRLNKLGWDIDRALTTP